MNRSILTKWLPGIVFGVVLGFLAGAQWVMWTRMAALESAQKEILQQFPAIKALLQGQEAAALPEPTDIKMSIEGAPLKGSADAKLTVIEFSDFECPYCLRYTSETYPQIEKDYINTGKIRYVFRHFPLERVHPHAVKAGEAGECARLQGKFWQMHDQLFANQKALETSALIDYGRAVGLDATAFQTCLNGPATAKVRSDLELGMRSGVTGTPTFFIGFAQKDGTVHVVDEIVGARPFAAFQSTLDRMLASPEAK